MISNYLSKVILHYSEDTLVIADKGYQGIKGIHEKSIHPIKRKKNVPLSDKQKTYNRLVSRLRFIIERVNGILKQFRILSSKYRNAPASFTNTFSLICGLYNFQCYI